ncbi:MAG: peroxidase [Planctomycetia bacterium]|nr:peroxidase [Planctomycetia bacterium]
MLLRFVRKAATASATMTAEDAATARAAGWTDEALYDAVTVVALFRFFNTWCDSHGVRAMPPAEHALSGKRIASEGYLPR